MSFEVSVSVSAAVSTIIRATLENPAAAKEYLRKLDTKATSKTPVLSTKNVKRRTKTVSERQREAALKAWATRRSRYGSTGMNS